MLARRSKKWKPHKYQIAAMEFLIKNAAAGLFLDPGLGKTSSSLGAFKVLKSKKLANRMLIIAPLRVCNLVWPAEIAKWTDFKNLKIVVLHGPKKEEKLKEDADIFIINPEGLDWLFGAKKTRLPNGKVRIDVDIKRVKGLECDTLVFDEISKFKNHSSQRFKMMKQVVHLFSRKWGLTGSPAANGLMGLFGICYMLDSGRTFGPYISHYRAKYFDKGNSFFQWTLKPGADVEIFERVKPLALRISDDVLDMPKLVPNDVKIDLPPGARALYDELENTLISYVEDKKVSAVSRASALIKCFQIANGAVYIDDDIVPLLKLPGAKKKWKEVHDEKIEALKDLVEDLNGSPLLCAYIYEHDLIRLKKAFGKNVPYFGKGVGEKREQWIQDAWNAGDLPLVLGQPQSIGHGLNLQESSQHVGWFGMTQDFEIYDQFIRRVRRQGNPHKRIYLHRFLARNSVDIVAASKLRGKETTQNDFFNALLQYRGK